MSLPHLALSFSSTSPTICHSVPQPPPPPPPRSYTLSSLQSLRGPSTAPTSTSSLAPPRYISPSIPNPKTTAPLLALAALLPPDSTSRHPSTTRQMYHQYYSPSLISEKPSSASTLYSRPIMSTVSSPSGSSSSGVAQRSSTWQDRLQGPQTLYIVFSFSISQANERSCAQHLDSLYLSIPTPYSHSPRAHALSFSLYSLSIYIYENPLLTSPSSPLLPTPPLIPRVQGLL